MAKIINKIPLIVGILVFIGLCVAYKAESPAKPKIEREIVPTNEPVGAIPQLSAVQKLEIQDIISKAETGKLTFEQAQKLIRYMDSQKAGPYKVRNDLLPQMLTNLKLKAN